MKKIIFSFFVFSMLSHSPLYAQNINPEKWKVMKEYTDFKGDERYLWFGDGYNMEILAQLVIDYPEIAPEIVDSLGIEVGKETNVNDIIPKLSGIYDVNLFSPERRMRLMKYMGIVTFRYEDASLKTPKSESLERNMQIYLNSFVDLMTASLSQEGSQEEIATSTAEMLLSAVQGFKEYRNLQDSYQGTPADPEINKQVFKKLNAIVMKILDISYPADGHPVTKEMIREKINELWIRPPVDHYTIFKSFIPAALKEEVEMDKAVFESNGGAILKVAKGLEATSILEAGIRNDLSENLMKILTSAGDQLENQDNVILKYPSFLYDGKPFRLRGLLMVVKGQDQLEAAKTCVTETQQITSLGEKSDLLFYGMGSRISSKDVGRNLHYCLIAVGNKKTDESTIPPDSY